MAEAQRATIPISEGRKSPQKVNFTKRSIEALKAPEKGRRYVYDSKTDGLAVAVSYSGSKTFYCYRKVHGRPQRIRLGKYPEMTVEQARRQAVQMAADIAEGKDPQAEKQRQRAEMTLGELHRRYMAEYAKVHKRSWKDDEDLFRRYLTHWQSRRLSTISRADVQKRHRQIGESAPVAANRMLAMLSKAFSFAVDIGAWEGENPCKGIKRFREKSRDRFLQADELPRFLEALEAEPNETMKDYILLSLLVGGRRGNMLAMQFDELHLERGEWRIPETKNGEALTVHLPPAAVEILQERQKRSRSVWVFPSKTSKSGHLEEPKKGWKRVCDRAGLTDVRLHDLRRTLGSWQAATGASLPVIGKSLGHKNQQTTAIYARLNLDPVKKASTPRPKRCCKPAGKRVNRAQANNEIWRGHRKGVRQCSGPAGLCDHLGTDQQGVAQLVPQQSEGGCSLPTSVWAISRIGSTNSGRVTAACRKTSNSRGERLCLKDKVPTSYGFVKSVIDIRCVHMYLYSFASLYFQSFMCAALIGSTHLKAHFAGNCCRKTKDLVDHIKKSSTAS